MTRALRYLVAAALMLALTACANNSSDALRIGKLMVQSLTGQGGEITREQAAAIPYASIGIRLGGSSQGVAVLGRGVADDRFWYSGETLLLVTRYGRLVQTVGLPYDLTHLEARGPGGGVPGRDARFTMMMDFRDLGAFNVVANCTDTDEGPETIAILGTQIQTRHHIEHCEAPQIDWTFENEFWLDARTGYVWDSIQNIHPRSSLLHITVFRPETTRTASQ